MKRSLIFFLSFSTLFVGPIFGQEGPVSGPILVAEIGAGGRSRTVGQSRVVPNSSLIRRDSNYSIELAAFDLLNTQRISRGLSPLTWDERVAGVARLHSRNMAAEEFFSHKAPDGSTLDSRADLLGLTNWTSIAENIAFLRGHEDPASKAIEKWMASPAHRRNILRNGWTRSAIGVALGGDGAYYFTQVFITSK